MTKQEMIDVLDSAYMKAGADYNRAEKRTPDEYISEVCMRIFDYLGEAIKELPSD